MTVLGASVLFQRKVTGVGEVCGELLPCWGAMEKQASVGGPSDLAVQPATSSSKRRRSREIFISLSLSLFVQPKRGWGSSMNSLKVKGY